MSVTKYYQAANGKVAKVVQSSNNLTPEEEGKLRQEDAGNVAFNLMLGENGPVRKLLDPFISEAIFFEKVLDTLPAGVGFGGRGGETKTGSRVYSETDDGSEAFMKSLVHIIEGVQPTAITTAGKLVQGLEKDLK